MNKYAYNDGYCPKHGFYKLGENPNLPLSSSSLAWSSPMPSPLLFPLVPTHPQVKSSGTHRRRLKLPRRRSRAYTCSLPPSIYHHMYCSLTAPPSKPHERSRGCGHFLCGVARRGRAKSLRNAQAVSATCNRRRSRSRDKLVTQLQLDRTVHAG